MRLLIGHHLLRWALVLLRTQQLYLVVIVTAPVGGFRGDPDDPRKPANVPSYAWRLSFGGVCFNATFGPEGRRCLEACDAAPDGKTLFMRAIPALRGDDE